MKNNKIIIIVTILIIIILSPKTVSVLKHKMNSSKYDIREIKEISIGYGPNIKFLKYKQGFLIYDGKSLKYINNKAERIFSLNIKIDNYSLDTSGNNIYILDKTNKEIYIINKKGSLINKVKTSENPLLVKSFRNGDFLVHYSTNSDVEGVKIHDSEGKEIKDISIPRITINFINIDPKNGGFLISGISTEKNSLFNRIIYYDKKGNFIFSDNIENKLFINSLFLENNIILVEPKYIEFRDRDFKTLSTLTLDDSIKNIDLINNDIGVIYNSNNFKYISEKGQEKSINYPIQNIKGFEQIGKETIIYSDRSIYFTKYKQEYNLKEDIVRVLAIDETNIVIIFRGNIKFLSLS